MKKELQDKLYKAYPELYQQHKLPPRETCMCWGISCGDGWYWLINSLSKYIYDMWTWNYKDKGEECPQAVQVKEKFGGLRFYIQGCNSKLMLPYHLLNISAMRSVIIVALLKMYRRIKKVGSVHCVRIVELN